MPRSFVTSTHAAPSSRRYASAWSSTLLRSEALSNRSRNCGTSALTALIPASAVVRPVRNAWTPRRTPARAWRIASSAVRCATSDGSRSVMPSTPTTDSVAAMKILARRPSRRAIPRIACVRLRSKRRSLLLRYRNRQVPPGPAGLGGKPAFQVLRCERARLGDERPCVVHLSPGVPEEHAAHSALFHVVDHAFAEPLLPVGDGLETRVDVTHRFVAELEQVGVEERQMVIGSRPPRHVEAGGAAHRVGVVFVLHAQPCAERWILEVRHVAGGIDVGLAGATRLVHDDSVVHAQAGLLRQFNARQDTESGNQNLRHQLAPDGRAHDA